MIAGVSAPNAQPARRVSAGGLVMLAAIMLLGALITSHGIRLLVRRQTDERARATVTRCTDSGTSRNRQTACTGTWTVDGRVRAGRVQGATSDQVGKTIDVTVRGDTAYVRDIKLAVMLTVLGLLPVALGLALLRGMFARPRTDAG